MSLFNYTKIIKYDVLCKRLYPILEKKINNIQKQEQKKEDTTQQLITWLDFYKRNPTTKNIGYPLTIH